jgi:hypothetical protein
MSVKIAIQRCYDDLLSTSSAAALQKFPKGDVVTMRRMSRLMSEFLELVGELLSQSHIQEDVANTFKAQVEPCGEYARTAAQQYLRQNKLDPVWEEVTRLRFQAISLSHWLAQPDPDRWD